jgi:hypothetical protein
MPVVQVDWAWLLVAAVYAAARWAIWYVMEV